MWAKSDLTKQKQVNSYETQNILNFYALKHLMMFYLSKVYLRNNF